MNRAVFLDRDGTMSYDAHYLDTPDRLRLYKSTVPALTLLQSHSFKIIMVTNQSGIARGLFSEATLHLIHDRLKNLLHEKSVQLNGIYYCPHHPDEQCRCRKPKTGLFHEAMKNHAISLPGSFMVGDSLCDIEAGHALGCQTILVLTGRGRQTLKAIREMKIPMPPHFVAPHLFSAAHWIIKKQALPKRAEPAKRTQSDIQATV